MLTEIVGVVTVVLILAVWIWTKWSQRKLDIPSPDGIPILGNLLQVDPEKPHFTFTDWTKNLGDIFCVRLCGKNLVVVSSFSTVHEVLVDKGQDLAGRPRNFVAKCFTNNFSNIGFCNPSPGWKMLRRSVHQKLRMFGSGFQRLESITGGVTEELKAEVVRCGRGGSTAIDIRPLLYSATMNIMCVFLVGNKYSTNDEEFLLFQEMERLGVTLIASAGKGAELNAFPWLRWIGNETYEQLVKFSNLRDKLYARLKERAEQEMGRREDTSKPCDAILPTLLKVLAETDEKAADFDEDNIKGTFVDLILGGTASTTNLVYAYLNIMLHNPGAYRRVKDEIAACMKATDSAATHRPSLLDKSSMPYTQATILELLRYVSIAPFTVPHQTLVDTVIAGYKIPRETEVLCNLWAVLHDDTIYDEPWHFKPERFLVADGSSLVPPEHPSRRHLIAFGAGPRHCIGEVFATSRLFLFITSILQDFDLQPENKHEVLVSCDPRTYLLGIALYPPDYKLRLIPTDYCKDNFRQSCDAATQRH